jgi:hypothetical protein
MSRTQSVEAWICSGKFDRSFILCHLPLSFAKCGAITAAESPERNAIALKSL